MMRRANKKRRKLFIPFIFSVIMIVLIGGYVVSKLGNEVQIDSEETPANLSVPEKRVQEKQEPAEATFPQQENDLDDLISRMTLQEKIGQLIVVGFQSKDVDEHIRTMITDYKVGGVIFYDRNMESPEQVARLTNDLQDLALENDKEIPIMFSIDQEGGQIVRMKEHVSPIPSQQELASKGDLEAVYDTAFRNGEELKAMGIHVNYAPVLDLSTTDSRSFGEDPKKTSEFGEQVIKGLTDAGITATLKHFPGHGRSNVDPHVESSSVEADQLDLENNDLYPFKKMIDDVDHNQFFIMVTHIKYPAYDKENPASISPVIIQDLLREKLGYDGIVVTDDLEMGAVNKYFSYGDLGYSAVKAGADLLLVCHTLESQKEVINGITEAVKQKKLSEERIDEAVKRILAYKLSTITSTHVDEQHAGEVVGE